jgi:hypothetical protein
MATEGPDFAIDFEEIVLIKKEKKIIKEELLPKRQEKHVEVELKKIIETKKITFKTIYIVFLELDESAKKHWRNRLAAWYTGSKWIHCELYFPDTHESFSVDTKNPVYCMTNKDYRFRKWHFYPLSVPEEQADKLYKACYKSLGEPFDKTSFSFFFCPIGCCIDPPNTHKKWLCSRYCATKMQEVGMLNKILDTYGITPKIFRREIFSMHKTIWTIDYQGLSFKDIRKEENIQYVKDKRSEWYNNDEEEKGQ